MYHKAGSVNWNNLMKKLGCALVASIFSPPIECNNKAHCTLLHTVLAKCWATVIKINMRLNVRASGNRYSF